MNNGNNVSIICDDVGGNALFISDGTILFRDLYLSGTNRVRGNLQQTSQSNIYNIVSVKNNCVVGIYDTSIGRPTYYPQQPQQTMQPSYQNINNTVGGINVTPVNIGGNMSTMNSGYDRNVEVTRTQTSQYVEPIEVVKPVEKKVMPLEGYCFNPVPTSYTDVEIEVTGSYYKWISKIKGEGMEKDAHMSIYETAVKSAKLFDDSMMVENEEIVISLNDDMAYTLLQMTLDSTDSSDMILVTGVISTGFYTSCAPYTTRNINTPSYMKYIEEDNVMIHNKFAEAIKMTSDLGEWFDFIGRSTTTFQQELINPYIIDLFKEYITVLGNRLKFHNTSNIFPIFDQVMQKIKGTANLLERSAYMDALDSIYRRLTNKNSVDSYSLVSNIEDKLIVCGGLDETFKILNINNKILDGELESVVNANDSTIYKCDFSTPFLKEVCTRVFERLNDPKVISDYFIIFTNNVKIKVVKKDNTYLIYTI